MNCNCIEEVNGKLKELNLKLSGYAYLMPEFKRVFTINTEWIDRAKAPKGQKMKPTSMWVSHCPFCGKPVEQKPTP